MNKRLHVPFDVFAMRTEVPVSTMVRDGDHGWTCGQCPLGKDGSVLSPDDLPAQAGHVCDMIEGVLPRADFTADDIAQLIVYHSGSGRSRDAALKTFADRFPGTPVLPVQVPHFYYDGMQIEVDVLAASKISRRAFRQNGAELGVAETGSIVWVAVSRPDTTSVEKALHSAGLNPDRLLTDMWFWSGGSGAPQGVFVSLPGSVAHMPEASDGVCASLAFAPSPVEMETVDTDRSRIAARQSGRFVSLCGISPNAQADLVVQTRDIMTGLADVLAGRGASFSDVTKLTAHYVGGATEEELHGNMTVRHSFYGKPGPASTGLPVSGFANPQCRIAIHAFAAL